MTTQFEHPTVIADQAHALAERLIDDALEQVQRAGKPDTRDKAVHSARKGFKKLRALVRLMRFGLGDDVYRRENHAFRDAGRPLSEARDGAVLIETIDALVKQGVGDVPLKTLSALRELLVIESQKRAGALSAAKLERIASALRSARRRVPRWPMTHDAWDAVGAGLRRIYARGRRAMDRAFDQYTFEAFHEWRKRAKDLWHALELLSQADPSRLEALADEAHQLGDVLGEDHDLAVLMQFATEQKSAAIDAGYDALAACIAARQKTLRKQAKVLGERLYADKPRRFTKDVEKAWSAWSERCALATEA